MRTTILLKVFSVLIITLSNHIGFCQNGFYKHSLNLKYTKRYIEKNEIYDPRGPASFFPANSQGEKFSIGYRRQIKSGTFLFAAASFGKNTYGYGLQIKQYQLPEIRDFGFQSEKILALNNGSFEFGYSKQIWKNKIIDISAMGGLNVYMQGRYDSVYSWESRNTYFVQLPAVDPDTIYFRYSIKNLKSRGLNYFPSAFINAEIGYKFLPRHKLIFGLGYTFSLKELVSGDYVLFPTTVSSSSGKWKLRGNSIDLSIGYAYLFNNRVRQPDSLPQSSYKTKNSIFFSYEKKHLEKTDYYNIKGPGKFNPIPSLGFRFCLGYKIAFKNKNALLFSFGLGRHNYKFGVNIKPFQFPELGSYDIRYTTLFNGSMTLVTLKNFSFGAHYSKHIFNYQKVDCSVRAGLVFYYQGDGFISAKSSVSRNLIYSPKVNPDTIYYEYFMTNLEESDKIIHPTANVQIELGYCLQLRHRFFITCAYEYSFSDFASGEYKMFPNTISKSSGQWKLRGNSFNYGLGYAYLLIKKRS
ncbi:MAG: hypothetical protein IPO27_10125 [Bacteroidetes bacterium]|nr:hypothetical protein [Bacteroidota bacterium]